MCFPYSFPLGAALPQAKIALAEVSATAGYFVTDPPEVTLRRQFLAAN